MKRTIGAPNAEEQQRGRGRARRSRASCITKKERGADTRNLASAIRPKTKPAPVRVCRWPAMLGGNYSHAYARAQDKRQSNLRNSTRREEIANSRS